jgi:H+/gluconate symporter-like permease
MEKFIAIVSALFLATFVVGIAFFSAPVWILLMPFRFAVAKADDAAEVGCEA